MKTKWPVKKLGEVVKTSSGTWGPADINGTPVLRSTNFTNNGYLKFDNVAFRAVPTKKRTKTILENGDILLEKSGGGPKQPVGRVVYFVSPDAKEYSFGNFIQRLRSSDEINDRYLFYSLLNMYLSGVTNRYQNQTSGIRNLDLANYLDSEVIVPPIEEQKKIVGRLDAIRKAQDFNDQLLLKNQELFESTFAYSINNYTGKRKSVGDFVSFSQLGLVKSKADYSVEPNSTKYVKMNAILENGEIDTDKAVKVNASKQEINDYRLEIGDFLFNTRNAPNLVGKSAVFQSEGEFIFNNNILRLRFERFLPEFMNAYFHTVSGKNKLNSIKSGTTSVVAIYQKSLFKLIVPAPGLEFQKKIVEKLDAVQNYKKLLLKQKELYQELFDSVLHKSMNGELD